MLLAYTYPLFDLLGTMLGFFIFLIWFWLLIMIFTDIFRSRDLGGGAKALWVIFVIVLPFLGILVYLIARGGKMHERAERQARDQQEVMDEYIKQTVAPSSTASQLSELADMRDKGLITQAEFDAQKAKLLA